MSFSKSDEKELQVAKNLLESQDLVDRLTEFIGKPLEAGFEMLPARWNEGITKVTQAALQKASEVAFFTMKDVPGEEASNLWHKAAVAASGGVGGFLGLKFLAIELPVSTTIMLRSIADIAREQGESINSTETKIACLDVLALGESGAFHSAIRSALAREVTLAAEFIATQSLSQKIVARFIGKRFTQRAAEFIARKGVTQKAAPALVRAIPLIAERYSLQISQKAAAQAVPFIGAAGGAVINTMFMDHFQDRAKGYFIFRKLGRKYGLESVKEVYDALPEDRVE